MNLKRNSKHILCSIKFFFENRAVYEIMWKNRTGQATDENMAHVRYMLDIYG
jgi:hypothetical protein